MMSATFSNKSQTGAIRHCAGLLALIVGLTVLWPKNLQGQASQIPSIINQPQNEFVYAGDTAIFSVTASGAQPLFYRWFGPTGQVPDGTNATLKILQADLADQGTYFVRVFNSFGSTQSVDALLTVMRVDFGDAPASYGTLLADNGAQHTMVQGVQLGLNISFEPDGHPDPSAAADSGDDGVIFLAPLVPGRPSTVRVFASTDGKLDAWIDFDANGDWSAAFDQIFASRPLNAGQNDLTFFVPATATLGNTFARFRFSKDGGLAPTGWTRDGEVEDYRVSITSGADVSVHANFSPDPLPPNTDGQCFLSIANFGPLAATNVIISNLLSGVMVVGVQADTDWCIPQPGGIVCMVSNLPPGDTRSIAITFHPQQPALLTNILSARSPVSDPDPNNNRSTVLVRAADPLVITRAPQDQRVVARSTVQFSVEARGVGALSYEWEVNGALVTTGTGPTLMLYDVQNSAEVRVMVSDAFGSIWSPIAKLTVLYPPQIIMQPLPYDIQCDVPNGTSVQFAVQAEGTPPFRYQWRLNGINIRGATNPVYTINNATRMDAGSYSVMVANEAGVVMSTKAPLTCNNIPFYPGGDFMGNPAPLPPAGVPGTSPFEGIIQADNCNFTKEPGEPNHAGKPGAHSVWYLWIAPVSGIATINTVGSAFDTLLAVYRPSDFREIASDEDSGGFRRSRVEFNVTANQPYLIVVDGFNDQCGRFALEWSVEQTTNFLATINIQPRSQSASRDGPLMLSIDAMPAVPNTLLSYQWVLNGRQIPNANGPDLFIQHLTANDVGTYTVRVFGSAGRFVESRPVTVEIGPFPNVQSQDKPEDLFPAADSGGPGFGFMQAMQAMSSLPPFVSVSLGIPGTQTMNNTNSTPDIDCFGIGNATRWLGLQVTTNADAAGCLLRIDTAGSAISTEAGVYHFVPPTCLQNPACMQANLVACNTNSGVIQFPAPLGAQYFTFVDGFDGEEGIINFNWILGRPPVINPAQSNCTVVVATNNTIIVASGVTNAIPTPTYQWYFNGAPMPNATNSNIVFGSIQSSNAGCYSVIVSNVFGIVTNKCCVVVNPPMLHYEADYTIDPPVCNISAVLLPGTILQVATNVAPIVSWQNVVTNDATNCNFFYVAPLYETNGQPIPQCFYRTMKP